MPVGFSRFQDHRRETGVVHCVRKSFSFQAEGTVFDMDSAVPAGNTFQKVAGIELYTRLGSRNLHNSAGRRCIYQGSIGKGGIGTAHHKTVIEPTACALDVLCDFFLLFAISIRSEEHTSELQSHSFISYAVFCLKKKK